MNLEALRADCIRVISQIGDEIWRQSRDLKHLQVQEKSAGDVATNLDLWTEEALRQQLTAALPGSQFLGEETSGELNPLVSDSPTWIVDPIDGTANFSRGYPQWSVSVALAVAGEPVLGVIADPSRQEMFYATRGQGAWLQGSDGVRRLLCATQTEPMKAIVSTVFPKPLSPLMQPYLQEFEAVIRSFGQVRRSGSMALELAYLSAARADAFWERGMQAWDAAAGMVLLREAGAELVALDGRAVLQSQMLAAGTPAMLPQLLDALNSAAIKK